jgi:hypothetical protein
MTKREGEGKELAFGMRIRSFAQISQIRRGGMRELLAVSIFLDEEQEN